MPAAGTGADAPGARFRALVVDGLTIARPLARAHDGDLRAASDGDLRAASDGPGRGATFTLTLRVTTAAPPGHRDR
jgi:hypothetical protein